MDSNNELKGIDIKNGTCYYFDGIIKTEELDLDNILIDKKSRENNENILVYNILYKTSIDAKSCGIRCDEIDGFIRVYFGTRYLTLFASKEI